MEVRENAAVTLFYPYTILWKQDHTRQCDTCLTGPSREWVSKRQEWCRDSIVRAAALVKIPSVDEAWTLCGCAIGGSMEEWNMKREKVSYVCVRDSPQSMPIVYYVNIFFGRFCLWIVIPFVE